MLDIPFFKQDTLYSCGPAALQMVFAYYSVRESEEDLMRELHTRKKDGTHHEGMIDLSRKRGFFVYVNDDSSLDEIREYIKAKKPVIVHFIEPYGPEGHYVVVKDVSNHSIIFNDPLNGENFKMALSVFGKRWFSEDHKYKKWIMVLSKEEYPFGSSGKHYHPTHEIQR
jgi:predicted double-glycine peptidase